jgi:hypothetical protein
MGCDIHMHVEKNDGDGVWFEDHAPAYDDRDYAVFAWLAGVRNRHDSEVLSVPRGLPIDASETVRAEFAENGGHNASFFTVNELNAAGRKPVRYHGSIEEKLYLQWRASGDHFPESWCQSTNVRTVSEARYKAGDRRRDRLGLYVECEWEVPMQAAFERFFKFLEECGREARLVFWFDR